MKNLSFLMLAGAAAVSLVMLLSGGILFILDHSLPAALKAMSIAVLALSPFPVASTIVLVRTLGRFAKDAESYATRDSLTGLYDQHAFWDMLQYETERSLRQKYKFSLLLIDIDNFKAINDTFGHEVGDAFLVQFSQILKAAIRKGDIAARYGGEPVSVSCSSWRRSHSWDAYG